MSLPETVGGSTLQGLHRALLSQSLRSPGILCKQELREMPSALQCSKIQLRIIDLKNLSCRRERALV